MKTSRLAQDIVVALESGQSDPKHGDATVSAIRSCVDTFEALRAGMNPAKALTSTTWDVVLCKIGPALLKPGAPGALCAAHPALAAAVPRALAGLQAARRCREAAPQTVWCAVAGARFPMCPERLAAFEGCYLATLLGAAQDAEGSHTFARPRRNADGDVVVDGITQEQFSYVYQFMQEGVISRLGEHNWKEVRDVAERFGPVEMIAYVDAVTESGVLPAAATATGSPSQRQIRSLIALQIADIAVLQEGLEEAVAAKSCAAIDVGSAAAVAHAADRVNAIQMQLSQNHAMLSRLRFEEIAERRRMRNARLSNYFTPEYVRELDRQFTDASLRDEESALQTLAALRFGLQQEGDIIRRRLTVLASKIAEAQRRVDMLSRQPEPPAIAALWASDLIRFKDEEKDKVARYQCIAGRLEDCRTVLSQADAGLSERRWVEAIQVLAERTIDDLCETRAIEQELAASTVAFEKPSDERLRQRTARASQVLAEAFERAAREIRQGV